MTYCNTNSFFKLEVRTKKVEPQKRWWNFTNTDSGLYNLSTRFFGPHNSKSESCESECVCVVSESINHTNITHTNIIHTLRKFVCMYVCKFVTPSRRND